MCCCHHGQRAVHGNLFVNTGKLWNRSMSQRICTIGLTSSSATSREAKLVTFPQIVCSLGIALRIAFLHTEQTYVFVS
jgi:hypothetical protein